MKPRGRAEPLVLLGAGAVLLVASGIHPRDRFTWSLEIAGRKILRVLRDGRPLRPVNCEL